jgi:alanyl-tRNA synthetase
LLIVSEPIAEGSVVNTYLNWDFRYTQMKLHSSLNLLHYIISKYYNKEIDYPISSDITDDFGYNKYPENMINEDLVNYVSKELDKMIKNDNPVVTSVDENDKNYRYWECMNYIIPCGGVHIKNLKEINCLKMSVHTKKGVTTIKLTL